MRMAKIKIIIIIMTTPSADNETKQWELSHHW